MDRGQLAARRAWALETIEEKSGIDLSRTALPKAPSVEIFQLFQLEKLADAMKGFEEDEVPATVALLDEVLSRISNISGVGPSLLKKIKEELADLL